MSARRRALWADGIARVAITSGGIAIILSVVAILFFIGREALPLFLPARGEAHAAGRELWPAAELPLLVRTDEYRTLAVCVLPSGRIETRSLRDASLAEGLDLGLPPGVRLVAADAPADDHRVVVAGSDGVVRLVDVRFAVQGAGEARQVLPRLSVARELPLLAPGAEVTAVAFRREEGRFAVAAAATGGGLRLHLENPDEGESREFELALEGAGLTRMAVTGDLGTLLAGTRDGRLLRWSLSPETDPRLEETDRASEAGSAITSVSALTGGRSLAVASESGEVSVWSLVRDGAQPSGWALEALHYLPAAPAGLVALSASERFRGFVAADRTGGLSLYHATSERRVLHLPGAGVPVLTLAMAPRSDGAVGVDARGTLWEWSLEAPHPEVTWGTLFGRVWYEGYDRPEYVWQSTGSTDDFEPKLSLTPLVFGTLKGTLYALLFAVPVSVLAAIYTALFAQGRLRAAIKPTVELMAGLPSVVIGFLAGLWMAPLVERHLAGVLLSLLLLPALVLLAAAAWSAAPVEIRKRLPSGAELGLLVLLLTGGMWLALTWGPGVEEWVFAGDLRSWLYQTLGLQYDQRNALVVGFAMGFAVIPVIFTISEDSLSSVPEHLVSGAMALGASRWQTALRVVVPTASPGIFSAVMIGFGRAVGETMIVLMATGNTPVLDWSLFNGLRTLSANIAVEMPEAPHGGTLYRVLFVAAALLFVITFMVNTAAELGRMRLRARYARL